MKVHLPTGIVADWSPSEIAEGIRILTAALLAEATGHGSQLVLAHPQIVRYGDRHARLTATPYALLRFLLSRGTSVEFDDAREAVWLGRPVSDKRIMNACSEASSALMEAGIPYEVTCEASMVSLREIQVPGNPGQIRESVS